MVIVRIKWDNASEELSTEPDDEEMPNKIQTLKTKHKIAQGIAAWVNLLPMLPSMESTVII